MPYSIYSYIVFFGHKNTVYIYYNKNYRVKLNLFMFFTYFITILNISTYMSQVPVPSILCCSILSGVFMLRLAMVLLLPGGLLPSNLCQWWIFRFCFADLWDVPKFSAWTWQIPHVYVPNIWYCRETLHQYASICRWYTLVSGIWSGRPKEAMTRMEACVNDISIWVKQNTLNEGKWAECHSTYKASTQNNHRCHQNWEQWS